MLDQLANAYLAAEGSCHGNPKIKAGDEAQDQAASARDSPGTYRVAKAKHLARHRRRLHHRSSPTRSGEHTLIGQTGGGNSNASRNDSIITGIVTNNNDPDKLGRGKVKLPAVSDQESFWIPVSAPRLRARSAGSRCCRCPASTWSSHSRTTPSVDPYALGSMFDGKDTPGEGAGGGPTARSP